jgi:hypothetical protein
MKRGRPKRQVELDTGAREELQKQIRRGTHRSMQALVDAIENYVSIRNESPSPFIWTKSADQIFASITRFCVRTSDPGH